MFNIEPNREPEPRRAPIQPGPSRMPLARPPAQPRTWWGTVPGQLALVAMFVGGIVIVLGLMGVVGPLSLR